MKPEDASTLSNYSQVQLSCQMQDTNIIICRGGAMGGGARGAKAPLKISKKGKMKKYDVFSDIKVIKISFSVIFNKEIRALEGLLSRF